MQLEELKPGLRIDGVIPAEVITVIGAQGHGADALELTYKNASGGLGQQVVFRKDEADLSIAPPEDKENATVPADSLLLVRPDVAEKQRSDEPGPAPGTAARWGDN